MGGVLQVAEDLLISNPTTKFHSPTKQQCSRNHPVQVSLLIVGITATCFLFHALCTHVMLILFLTHVQYF